MIVLVVLVLAGLAVLGAVVVLAMGRGGELAETHPDHPPLPLPTGRPITGPEVALLRLPRGLWGYHVGVTDEALHRLAYALAERDARMNVLEGHLAELRYRLGEQDVHEDGQLPPLPVPEEDGLPPVPEVETVPSENGAVAEKPDEDTAFEDELFEDSGPFEESAPVRVVLTKDEREVP